MGGKATPAVMVHLKGVTSSTQTGASTIPVKNGVYTFHGFRDVDGVLMQLLKFIAREHKMKGGSSLKGENKKSTQEKKAELIEVEEKRGTTAGSPKRLSGGSGSHRRPRGGVAGKQDSGEPNNNKVTSSSHGSSTDAPGGAGVDNAEQQRAAVAAQKEELRQQQEAATRNYNVGLATLLLVVCFFLFQCVLPLFGGGPSYLRLDALHSQDELQALYGGENAAYVVQHHVDTLVPPSLQHMRNRLGWQQCSAIGILVVCALLLGYRLGMAAPSH